MELQTIVPLPDYPFKIAHQDALLSMGSCFAEHIGQRLEADKFFINTNPFGVLYNPASISRSLFSLIYQKTFLEKDLFCCNGLYSSFQFHSRYAHPEKQKALKLMNTSVKSAANQFRKSKVLLLTLGTAWYYRLRETNEIVANCHKIPASAFTRHRLSIEESVDLLKEAVAEIGKKNPGCKMIWTVSPVRHLKDGPIENMRSKAILLETVHRLCETIPNNFYFPAFEIFLDQLRDYRYYQPDMVHPGAQAADYVYRRFSEAFFDNQTMQILKEIRPLLTSLKHRSAFPQLPAHQIHLEKLRASLQRLEARHPWIDFKAEKKILGKN